MKRFQKIIMALSIPLLFSPQVAALDGAQKQVYSSGIHYFDISNSCSPSTSTTPPSTAISSFSSLTGDQKISGTFLLGFDAKTPQSTIEEVFKKYKAGGLFILGTSDAASAGFNKTFFDQLSQAAGHQIVAASDEEGWVTRYKYNSFPSAGQMSSMSDSEVQNIGKQVGQVMATNGLNTDLAPVLDVGTGNNTDFHSSPVQDNRTFGTTYSKVTDKADAFAAGLQSAGINPTYKHFPGLGSTFGSTDSQPNVTSPALTQLQTSDLKPYDSLANKNGAAVMLDNAHVPGLTAPGEVASISPATVNLLRGTPYNFSGLIMTDDLTASSVPVSTSQAVADALKAGVDMPLLTYTGDGVIDSAIADAKSANVNTSQALQELDNFVGNSSSSPQGSSNCCGSGGGGSLTGSDNVAKTINFFEQEGLSAAQAVGIAANFMWETGGGTQIDPTSGGSPSAGALGIAHWTPGSKVTEDKNFNRVTGSDTDLLTQLQVVWDEMNGKSITSWSGWAANLTAFKQITNAGQAADYFRINFEACNASYASCTPDRVNLANQLIGQYGGGGGGGGGNCSSPNSGSTGLTNPFPDGWTPGRLDMGYDGHFTNQIVSPCGGNVVAAVLSSGPGSWRGYYMAVQCSQSISGLPTKTFYFSEGLTPTVKSGAVTAGQQIAVPGPTGFTEGPGGIEWGLAGDSNPTQTYAVSLGGVNTCSPTAQSRAMVLSFYQWVQTNLVKGTTTDESCAGAP